MLEIKKACKIMEEFMLYLLKSGFLKVDSNISIEREQTTFTFETKKCKDKFCTQVEEFLNVGREFEVEEYGWELMGESDATNELELLGLLVDTVDIKHENEKTIFRIIRKNV